LGAAAIAAVLFSGCTGGPQPSAVPSAAGTAGAGASAQPTDSASTEPTTKPSPGSSATSKNQPVPKVLRSGQAEPSITAKPSDTDGKVSYSDGVQLRIGEVKFGKEKGEGPGMFPGRAYAILDLQIGNGSDKTLSLDTTVVTVLDKNGKAVNPVYVDEAKVADFAGDLKPGSTANARYAFAVPNSSRSKVTVVVDFDGVHSSAVFRGGLS
jgi:hypothetical protein